MMPAVDMDRIVEEVLRELRHVLSAGAPAAPSAKQAPAPPPTAPAATAARVEAPRPALKTELALSNRLVTMADVEGRLSGIRRVVVPARAIVTPAVRDELLRRRVELRFASADKAKTAAASTVRLEAIVAATGYDPQPLAAALKHEKIEVALDRLKCVMATSDRLAEAVRRPGTLGLMLTRHTAAGMCLLGRLPSVRPVLAFDAAQAMADAEAIGANVLVIDPRAYAPAALQRLVVEFCRAGVRACPAVFEKRLG